MTLPLLSLAAGVLPELGPVDVVRAAGAAGFDGAGIWFDAETWTDGTTREVAAALDDTGLVALDVEALFVTPDGDDGDRLVDAAAGIGARNVLTISRGVEPGPFSERFAELCRQAQPAGIAVCIEFTRLFTIADLPTALAVVDAADEPNAGVLVDNLHLARCGHTADDIGSLPPELFPYVQLCDAPAELSDESSRGLYVEAVDGRCNLGEGGLPVREVYRAFVRRRRTGPPVSLEIRSRALRDRHPDPVERALSVLTAARDTLTLDL